MGIKRVQLAPCDMPWINPQVFERLREGNRPVIMPRNVHLQPLLSLVDVSVALSALERAGMRTSLKNTLRSIPCQIVDFSRWGGFRNINAASDLSKI
ncbi:MAG: hypothetical protein VX473_02200, partial [Candidatus Thermoplasmatota archaeon]|nr:hypothetical protein [Candidatus Thermoplasmatota archaeon]